MRDELSDRRNPTRLDRRRAPSRPGGRRITDPPAEWLTISAYARRYGISRGIVYKWLDASILQTYRVGTLLRIRNLPPDEHPDLKSVDPRS